MKILNGKLNKTLQYHMINSSNIYNNLKPHKLQLKT